jgi:glyoxylase-like metal-dependent hydrolase (beta-lactamase superfamily II)/ACT domain-containing protein
MSGYLDLFTPLDGRPGWLARGAVWLPDQPGSLAWLAGLFGEAGANIIHFHHNRSEHPNRVLLEAWVPTPEMGRRLREELGRGGALDDGRWPATPPLVVTDADSILRLEVGLEHVPGSLARLAALLRDHQANVIFFSYHEDVSPQSVQISLFTGRAGEIDRLLRDLNQRGYHYTIRYRGASQREVDDVIGLNLVERFYFQIRRLLGSDDAESLRRMVESSRSMSEALVRFSQEAGRHLEAGEVYTRVLAFASGSQAHTGPRFSYRRLPSLTFDDLSFHAFRLPSGGNVFVLEAPDELVMVDSPFGVYHRDVTAMLEACGLPPAKLRRLYVTHTDADHAGMAGSLEDEFGTRVFLHHRAGEVLQRENRAWGGATTLLDLNHHFTVLVNGFTRFRAPARWEPLGQPETAPGGPLPVIDRFQVGGRTFHVLESNGGHTTGGVFYLGIDTGLLFTGDYLLWLPSLNQEERDFLSLPRFMMTSTNADSGLFREETQALTTLALALDRRLAGTGGEVRIVPGHGDYYPARQLGRG